MAGEETMIRVQITNTSSDLLSDVLFSDALDPALHPLEVRATQGAARVEGQSVIVDMGTLEAGQTAVVIIGVRVISEAQAGQIILNQATIYFGGDQIISDVSAAGLPPSELPATGQDTTRPSAEDGSH
jgi:type VI protein secretion system component VasA